MGRGRSVGILMAVAAMLGGPGCATRRTLAPTPILLQNVDPQAAFADCPDGCRRPEMEVLFVTDRSPGDLRSPYGSGRSRHLEFGAAVASFDSAGTWKQLSVDSTMSKRAGSYDLTLASSRALGRIDSLPPRRTVPAPMGDVTQASATESDLQIAAFQQTLSERLARTARKEVFVYVHGFNVTFEDAVFRAGEIWHFLGRIGVPVAYTWPAGFGGLRGYAYDRESGEFTVTHLKQFLLAVAACPQVERLHVVAHSRGTDVAISALRELHIAYQAQGRSTADALKLENLVLAAPDLDEEVFFQRFVAENMLGAARRTTIYASRNDRALELADLIFSSTKRVGMLRPRDVTPRIRQALAKIPNVQFIECRVPRQVFGHDYVFENPAAMSDLILVLRDRRPPGAEHGRPLHQPVEGTWELNADYLRPASER